MEEKLKYCGSERSYVIGSIPVATIYMFFLNLVIMYWTLNSIYMQFE